VYFNTLLLLESDYNAIGLTLQISPHNRALLCKIVDNKPFVEEVLVDYIFVCPVKDKDNVISDNIKQHIIDFILNAASAPSQVRDTPRKWQEGTRTYGNVVLVNEDVNFISQSITD
jgi:hypothetical protein